MYNPKSDKDVNKVKPAPYADAAVNDEELTSPEDKKNFSEDEDVEDDDPVDEVNDRAEIEEIEIEDIETEDVDDSRKREQPEENEDFEE